MHNGSPLAVESREPQQRTVELQLSLATGLDGIGRESPNNYSYFVLTF